MRTLNLLFIFVMFWLPFCSKTMAVCADVSAKQDPEDNVLFYRNISGVDWVGGALIDDAFYASGNIYMEYDYFLANQSKGLEFEVWGRLFFLPYLENGFSLLDFGGYSKGYGVAYSTDDLLVDYWITADSTLDADYFFAMKNVYVFGEAPATPVPVPAAYLLFASSLATLAWQRKTQRFAS